MKTIKKVVFGALMLFVSSTVFAQSGGEASFPDHVTIRAQHLADQLPPGSEERNLYIRVCERGLFLNLILGWDVDWI